MRFLRFTGCLLLAAATLGATACRKAAPRAGTAARAKEELPPEVEATVPIHTSYATSGIVFYHQQDAAAATATLKELAAEVFPGMPILEKPDKDAPRPSLLLATEAPPFKDFSLPAPASFRYYSVGLKPEDVRTIHASRTASFIGLRCSADDALALGRKFTVLSARCSERLHAYLWDESTRQCYTHDGWVANRLDTWPEGGTPDVRHHVNMHAYQPDDASPHIRAVTLGMEKFALPDLVIERMPRTHSERAGDLINVVAQSLVERPFLAQDAPTTFRVKAIDNEAARSYYESSMRSDARARADLELTPGKRDEGDAPNDLLEIRFPGTGSPFENLASTLTELWGSHEAISRNHHDDKIEELSRQARERLFALRPAFLKGLAPGEILSVKAPFAADGDAGTEWMWVEVSAWPSEDKIDGILVNEPYHISGLKSGAKVTIDAHKTFDYLFTRADGSREGNTTAVLLEQNVEEE